MSEASVVIDHIKRRFGSFVALEDVSLEIARGEFVVLLGPSGSGKTTLLSILGGFLRPSEGKVLIEGRDMTAVSASDRPTITVFQDYALFPHKSVEANVGFGLQMRNVPRQTRRARVQEMLELVGLPDVGPRGPHELSGGQRQRIALARALAVEPTVLLLDEPLGALDLKLRRQMQDELKSIQRSINTTFIHVTHDQEEAMAIADTVVVMNHGRIEDCGEPERVYSRPRSVFAAGFMGDTNLIPARVTAANADAVSVTCEVGTVDVPHAAACAGVLRTDQAVTLSIRPEHIFVERQNNKCIDLGAVLIDDLAFFGTFHECRTHHETAASFAPVVYLADAHGLGEGDRVSLYADPDNFVVFPNDDQV